jgi:hypothetical protein
MILIIILVVIFAVMPIITFNAVLKEIENSKLKNIKIDYVMVIIISALWVIYWPSMLFGDWR